MYIHVDFQTHLHPVIIAFTFLQMKLEEVECNDCSLRCIDDVLTVAIINIGVVIRVVWALKGPTVSPELVITGGSAR